MPRRVLSVTALHIRQHKLDTEDGRKKFMAVRMEDHAEWTCELHKHPRTGAMMLVMDHVDHAKPLAALKPYHHAGRPLVHSGGFPMVECATKGCTNESIHGLSHCEVHAQPP